MAVKLNKGKILFVSMSLLVSSFVRAEQKSAGDLSEATKKQIEFLDLQTKLFDAQTRLSKARVEQEKALQSQEEFLAQQESQRPMANPFVEFSESEKQSLKNRYDGVLYISSRRISLNGSIEEGTGKKVVDQIIAFNRLDTNLPIFIVMDECNGGLVNEGLQILDGMEASPAPV